MASLLKVGTQAFYGCNGLTRVNISDLAAWCQIDFESGWYDSNPLSKAHHLYLNGKEVTDLIVSKSVTSISDYAFVGCSSLASVTIPSSVTDVGANAFSGCSGIKSVVMKSRAMTIGTSAFSGCSGLTDVTIPDGSRRLSELFPSAYSQIERVVILAGDSIVSSAFDGCSKLEEVTIPKSVTYIGANAFNGCTALGDGLVIVDGCVLTINGTCPENVVVPDGTRAIAQDIFRSCSTLKTVTLPSGLQSIDDYMFYGCAALSSVVMPDSVARVGKAAFGQCTSLEKIEMSSAVISIGDSAFSGCSSLANITIPPCVMSIGNNAFSGCSSLTDITIPPSVMSIGNNAFTGCVGLGEGVVIADNCVLTVNGTCPPSVELPVGTRLIVGGAFSGHTELTSITIPEGMTSVGDSTFSGCSGLTTVVMPSRLDNLGSAVFSGCSALTCVTIPDGVTSIGRSMFENCSALTAVTLPTSVTNIGSYAFEYCHALPSVALPEGVESIGYHAFAYCEKLENVSFPSTLKYIDNEWGYAFYDSPFSASHDGELIIAGTRLVGYIGTCPSEVVVPMGITEICDRAFYFGKVLSVSFPDSLKRVGCQAFYREYSVNGDGIRSVVITNVSDLVIEEKAFYGNPMQNITITGTNVVIGTSAFEWASSTQASCWGQGSCWGVRIALIGKNITIGDRAFANMGMAGYLSGVDVDLSGVKSVGGKAFQGFAGSAKYLDYFEASCISVGLFDSDFGVKRCEHGALSAECSQRAA